MHEVIGSVDALTSLAQGDLVEKIPLDYFGAGEPPGEALSVSRKTANGMAGLE
jgi:hypothetical protein